MNNPSPAPKGKQGNQPDPRTLRKVQVQPDGRRVTDGISVAKYNEMSAAYFDVQTVNHVARTCGVQNSTAKKYVEVGDPKRGLQPIKQRFLDIQRKVQRKQERTWEVAMEENRALLLRTKTALAAGLQKLQGVDVAPVLSLADAKTLAEILDRVSRTESFLFGGPDSRSDVHVSSAQFQGWTDEEVQEYIRTGKRPQSAGSAITTAGVQKATEGDGE